MAFSDDFARADGAIGADWIALTALPSAAAGGTTVAITDPQPFTISSGAALGVLDSAGTPYTAAVGKWKDFIPGWGQWCEATFTFPGTGPVASDTPYIYFYMLLDDSDFTCVGVQLLQNQLGFRLRWYYWVAGLVWASSYDYFHEWVDTSHTITMRFEAEPDGKVRAFLDGVPLVDAEYDFDVPSTGATLGTQFGMSAKFLPGSGGGGAIPKIEAVRGDALTPPDTSATSFNWRPFTVRRTAAGEFGGDVLREDDLTAWHAALRFGARLVLPEEVEGTALLTRPHFYDSAVVTVQIPSSIDWSRAVLVRGGFGAPTTPQDGVTIWYGDQVPVDANGRRKNLSQEVLDTPLTSPNWYYYSLFLWVGGQWFWATRAEVLVPMDHGWGELLFNSIPPFYQKTDDEQAADGRNGPLRSFSNVLGYDLSYTQCWADGLLNIYNVDRSPMKLLRPLGNNMGFPHEQALGGNRTRSVIEQLDDLNGLRGTRLGLQRLIEASSDYTCAIRQGSNELLSVDDGDFHGDGGVPEINPLTLPVDENMTWGIGHWEPLDDGHFLDKIYDPFGGVQTAYMAKDTPPIIARNTVAGPGAILTPRGGRGAMVVNGPGPETVVICGHLVRGFGVAMEGPAVSGVPVVPGALYEFSVETIRTGWGATSEQPPQARVILGVFWWDINGNELVSETGPPDVNDNFDSPTTWERTSIQVYAPDDGGDPDYAWQRAYYATPFIWWRNTGTWTGHATDVSSPPLFGRYIAMANFGRVKVEGGDVIPLSPDIYLTLGVDPLAGPQSHLGEP